MIFLFFVSYPRVTHHIPDMFPCVMPLDSMTRFLVSRLVPRPMTTSCHNIISILTL